MMIQVLYCKNEDDKAMNCCCYEYAAEELQYTRRLTKYNIFKFYDYIILDERVNLKKKQQS